MSHPAPSVPTRQPLAVLTACLLLLAAGADAQTFNWGNAVFDTIVDSGGNPVNPATFTFELGAFTEGFDPANATYQEWIENWQVFDTADYNPLTSQFGSTAYMQPDGTSPLDPGGFSFLNQQAYLWIRNGDDPLPGTEWLLVTTDSWMFPAAADDPCCPKSLPYEWFASDLTGTDVPLYGSQGGIPGEGEHTDSGTYTLQTYTFVPEPAAVSLLGLAGLAALRRRRGA